MIADRAIRISYRVSIRALKLSNFEKFRTLKSQTGVYDFRALKLPKRSTKMFDMEDPSLVFCEDNVFS